MKLYVSVDMEELGFNAYVAGYYGVPVIMVAGDDGAALEAETLIPNIVTAIVKETTSRSSAISITPTKAAELLKQKTAIAIENIHNIQPLTPPEKPILSIEFANYGQV